MTELSTEDERRVEQLLNTMDEETLNLVALDRKYTEEWYEEQLCHLRQMDEYFKEVGQVMNMCGKHDVERAVDQRRDDIARVMTVYENALEDLRNNNRTRTVA